MRRNRLTIGRMMIRVAVIGVLLAMFRWNAALLVVSAMTTFVPSFAWADTGGKLRKMDPARGTTGERLDLFAWAWLFSTMGLVGLIHLAAMIQGIRLAGP